MDRQQAQAGSLAYGDVGAPGDVGIGVGQAAQVRVALKCDTCPYCKPRRLMAQANYELHTMGDRVQASDKASGAVAHAVKAIGEDREWRHGSHNLRRDIAGLLADEYGQPEVLHLQAIADQLHDNYFEDRLSDSLVSQLVAEVTRLIDRLWEVREAEPNPDFSPSPEQQRIINRLRIPEDVAREDDTIDLPPPMPPFNPPAG